MSCMEWIVFVVVCVELGVDASNGIDVADDKVVPGTFAVVVRVVVVVVGNTLDCVDDNDEYGVDDREVVGGDPL